MAGQGDEKEQKIGGDWKSRLSPTILRLLGVAAGGPDENDYHEYLVRKYGEHPSADEKLPERE